MSKRKPDICPRCGYGKYQKTKGDNKYCAQCGHSDKHKKS